MRQDVITKGLVYALSTVSYNVMYRDGVFLFINHYVTVRQMILSIKERELTRNGLFVVISGQLDNQTI